MLHVYSQSNSESLAQIYATFAELQNFFQSIFVYIRQPDLIIARPIHRQGKAVTTLYRYYHTYRREERN